MGGGDWSEGGYGRSGDAYREPKGLAKFKRDFKDGFTGMHLNNMFDDKVSYNSPTVTLGILSRLGAAVGGGVGVCYAIYYFSQLK